MPQLPTILVLNQSHNHLLNGAALTYRDVSKETEERFRTLFRNNLTPTAALEVHKDELRLQYGSDYEACESDRSICPEIQWCYR